MEAFFDKRMWEEAGAEEVVNGLQLAISDAVLKKKPVSLVVFLDGDHAAMVMGEAVPEYYVERMMYDTHITVSLTKILKDFMAGDLAPDRIGKLHILQPNEAALLEMIHSGEYHSVKINFRNQQMKSLELVKSQDVTRKIVDVLAESNYQDIQITTHKGMVTKIENTVKINFD